MPAHRASRSEKPRTRTTRQPPKKNTALTCRGCRSRKIRCDGAQPSCGICLAYNEDCCYDKLPSMSQVLFMTERIAELERLVQDLQHTTSVPSAALQLSSAEGEEANDIGHEEQGLPAQVEYPPVDEDLVPPVAPLDRDDTYYETTSAVHGPKTIISSSEESRPLCFKLPTMNQPQLAFWEEQTVEVAAVQLSLPVDTIRHLLNTHWTWVHPTFMFVNRETFLKDAATGGEYCSPLLLSVICLHSTRFTDHHLSEELLARCNLLLGQEIHKGGSITTVQALLQLSAREIGKGNLSQSWLYSGMASRISIELGLYSQSWGVHEHAGYAKIRHNQISYQLAWSCYLWDKVISLYFGRSPSLPEPPVSDGDLDVLSDEGDHWRPNKDDQTHPGTPSYKITCFLNFCKLGVIITDVLLKIYGRLRTRDILEFVQKTQHKLQAWRSESPEALIVDPSTHPQVCPPPHILTQNLLYYATIILLHRPFKNNISSRATCRTAAAGVEHIFLLMERHFGLDKCTYVMCYCAYTAATVSVQDTRDQIPGAKERLDTYLRALKATRASCPGIQRSIDIIASCVSSDNELQPAMNDALNSTLDNSLPAPPPQVVPEDMPAFPHNNDHANLLDGMDMDNIQFIPQSFLYLDSFPQESFDLADGVLDQFDFGLPDVNSIVPS